MTDDVLYPRETWEWFGSAGHLIVGQDCRFHLCTRVGPWLVSTVGQYLPGEAAREIHCEVRKITLEGQGDYRLADFMKKVGYLEVGLGRKFETMVFFCGTAVCDAPECDCKMPMPKSYSELDADGYNTTGAATRGHMALCEKWARMDPNMHALGELVNESD